MLLLLLLAFRTDKLHSHVRGELEAETAAVEDREGNREEPSCERQAPKGSGKSCPGYQGKVLHVVSRGPGGHGTHGPTLGRILSACRRPFFMIDYVAILSLKLLPVDQEMYLLKRRQPRIVTNHQQRGHHYIPEQDVPTVFHHLRRESPQNIALRNRTGPRWLGVDLWRIGRW